MNVLLWIENELMFFLCILKCLEGIPRKAYYLATKVGRYEKDPQKMFDFSRDRTLKSIEESLNRLKLDYVDLLQV